MNTFKLSKNVPDTYVKHSRDFQLLCNSFDCLQGCTKYNIDSIINVNNTGLINENLLPILQTKLGFFTNKEFTSNEIRTVLQAFKHMVKNKGSRKGILQAITIFLKTSNLGRNSRIMVINKQDNIPVYIVRIGIESNYIDTTLLSELLKYIIPAGYIINYYFYEPQTFNTNVEYNNINTSDDSNNSINIIFTQSLDDDSIRITDSSYDTNGNYELRDSMVGTSGTFLNYGFTNTLTTITGMTPSNYSGDITIPSKLYDQQITSIGNAAFDYNTGIKKITLSHGITLIDTYAFFGCNNITSIIIPSSIISIGNYAFSGCTALSNVYYSGSEADKSNISIGSNNDYLLNATWQCNYSY